MKLATFWRRRLLVGAAISLGCAVLFAGGGVAVTAAGYVDRTHGRTTSLEVELPEPPEPEFLVGISRNARMVDTGLGLSEDGNAYVWGRTDMAMNGGASDPGTWRGPQRIPIEAGTVRQVTGQIYDANALDKDGYVWGWGFYNGRNGTDASRPSSLPTRLRVNAAWNSGSAPLLDQIVAISSTEYAGAGIRADGTVWHWGADIGYGGNGGTLGASQISGLPDPTVEGNQPVYLKGAYTNFFVILKNGDVYYWGGIGGNSLPPGVGNVGSSATKLTALNAWMKGNVGSGQPYIVAADGGINMGAALLSNGTVLSWGATMYRTGRGAPTSPAVIPGLSGIESMQFGFTGVAMGKSDGSLWGYGADDDYGLFPMTPTQIDTSVVQYGAGQGFYLWQKEDGTFWGQGYNPQGAIGLPAGNQRRQITDPDLSAIEVNE
ncbi:MAG: hypothetical protein QM628_02715 [Propionicimonas sp.]